MRGIYFLLVPVVVLNWVVFNERPIVLWAGMAVIAVLYTLGVSAVVRRVGRRVDLGRIRNRGRP